MAAFRSDVLPQVAARSGLLVIDEAHCISDWRGWFNPNLVTLFESTNPKKDPEVPREASAAC